MRLIWPWNSKTSLWTVLRNKENSERRYLFKIKEFFLWFVLTEKKRCDPMEPKFFFLRVSKMIDRGDQSTDFLISVTTTTTAVYVFSIRTIS